MASASWRNLRTRACADSGMWWRSLSKVCRGEVRAAGVLEQLTSSGTVGGTLSAKRRMGARRVDEWMTATSRDSIHMS